MDIAIAEKDCRNTKDWKEFLGNLVNTENQGGIGQWSSRLIQISKSNWEKL